jgi:hypothetical protein
MNDSKQNLKLYQIYADRPDKNLKYYDVLTEENSGLTIDNRIITFFSQPIKDKHKTLTQKYKDLKPLIIPKKHRLERKILFRTLIKSAKYNKIFTKHNLNTRRLNSNLIYRQDYNLYTLIYNFRKIYKSFYLWHKKNILKKKSVAKEEEDIPLSIIIKNIIRKNKIKNLIKNKKIKKLNKNNNLIINKKIKQLDKIKHLLDPEYIYYNKFVKGNINNTKLRENIDKIKLYYLKFIAKTNKKKINKILNKNGINLNKINKNFGDNNNITINKNNNNYNLNIWPLNEIIFDKYFILKYIYFKTLNNLNNLKNLNKDKWNKLNLKTKIIFIWKLFFYHKIKNSYLIFKNVISNNFIINDKFIDNYFYKILTDLNFKDLNFDKKLIIGKLDQLFINKTILNKKKIKYLNDILAIKRIFNSINHCIDYLEQKLINKEKIKYISEVFRKIQIFQIIKFKKFLSKKEELFFNLLDNKFNSLNIYYPAKDLSFVLKYKNEIQFMLIKFNPLRKINSSYNTIITNNNSDKNNFFDINKVKDFSFKNIDKFNITHLPNNFLHFISLEDSYLNLVDNPSEKGFKFLNQKNNIYLKKNILPYKNKFDLLSWKFNPVLDFKNKFINFNIQNFNNNNINNSDEIEFNNLFNKKFNLLEENKVNMTHMVNKSIYTYKKFDPQISPISFELPFDKIYYGNVLTKKKSNKKFYDQNFNHVIAKRHKKLHAINRNKYKLFNYNKNYNNNEFKGLSIISMKRILKLQRLKKIRLDYNKFKVKNIFKNKFKFKKYKINNNQIIKLKNNNGIIKNLNINKNNKYFKNRILFKKKDNFKLFKKGSKNFINSNSTKNSRNIINYFIKKEKNKIFNEVNFKTINILKRKIKFLKSYYKHKFILTKFKNNNKKINLNYNLINKKLINKIPKTKFNSGLVNKVINIKNILNKKNFNFIKINLFLKIKYLAIYKYINKYNKFILNKHNLSYNFNNYIDNNYNDKDNILNFINERYKFYFNNLNLLFDKDINKWNLLVTEILKDNRNKPYFRLKTIKNLNDSKFEIIKSNLIEDFNNYIEFNNNNKQIFNELNNLNYNKNIFSDRNQININLQNYNLINIIILVKNKISILMKKYLLIKKLKFNYYNNNILDNNNNSNLNNNKYLTKLKNISLYNIQIKLLTLSNLFKNYIKANNKNLNLKIYNNYINQINFDIIDTYNNFIIKKLFDNHNKIKSKFKIRGYHIITLINKKLIYFNLDNNKINGKNQVISKNIINKNYSIINYNKNLPRSLIMINQFLKSINRFNTFVKGTIVYFNKFINYKFYYKKYFLIKNFYKLLFYTFKSMNSLISRPVLVYKPNKIIIRLFYFILLPTFLKKKKFHRRWRLSELNSKNKKDPLRENKKIFNFKLNLKKYLIEFYGRIIILKNTFNTLNNLFIKFLILTKLENFLFINFINKKNIFDNFIFNSSNYNLNSNYNNLINYNNNITFKYINKFNPNINKNNRKYLNSLFTKIFLKSNLNSDDFKFFSEEETNNIDDLTYKNILFNLLIKERNFDNIFEHYLDWDNNSIEKKLNKLIYFNKFKNTFNKFNINFNDFNNFNDLNEEDLNNYNYNNNYILERNIFDFIYYNLYNLNRKLKTKNNDKLNIRKKNLFYNKILFFNKVYNKFNKSFIKEIKKIKSKSKFIKPNYKKNNKNNFNKINKFNKNKFKVININRIKVINKNNNKFNNNIKGIKNLIINKKVINKNINSRNRKNHFSNIYINLRNKFNPKYSNKLNNFFKGRYYNKISNWPTYSKFYNFNLFNRLRQNKFYFASYKDKTIINDNLLSYYLTRFNLNQINNNKNNFNYLTNLSYKNIFNSYNKYLINKNLFNIKINNKGKNWVYNKKFNLSNTRRQIISNLNKKSKNLDNVEIDSTINNNLNKIYNLQTKNIILDKPLNNLNNFVRINGVLPIILNYLNKNRSILINLKNYKIRNINLNKNKFTLKIAKNINRTRNNININNKFKFIKGQGINYSKYFKFNIFYYLAKYILKLNYLYFNSSPKYFIFKGKLNRYKFKTNKNKLIFYNYKNFTLNKIKYIIKVLKTSFNYNNNLIERKYKNLIKYTYLGEINKKLSLINEDKLINKNNYKNTENLFNKVKVNNLKNFVINNYKLQNFNLIKNLVSIFKWYLVLTPYLLKLKNSDDIRISEIRVYNIFKKLKASNLKKKWTTRFKFRKRISDMAYWFKKLRKKRRKNKIKKKLFLLSKVNINKLFKFKFKTLTDLLSDRLKNNIQLELIRLHYPYKNSNILANFLALLINRIKFIRLTRKIIKYSIVKRFNNHNLLNTDSKFPSYLSGFKIKIGGRLMKYRVVRKRTVKYIERGASSIGKVNYTDWGRFTNKNRRGAYSITVSTGQNFF